MLALRGQDVALPPKPDPTEPTVVFLSNTTYISNSAVSLERVDLEKVTALHALLLLYYGLVWSSIS